MLDIKWRFPLSGGGKKVGISDSGIESFTGRRISSLTREIIQNSLDAVDNRLESKVVKVEFSAFNIDSKNFPGHLEILKSMELSFKESLTLKQTKTKNFFDRAIKILKSNKIRMLRISDFNTKGLDGVGNINDYNSPWYYLVKSQGISDKEEASGGSFGIGKNASFVVSNLRTVFYETLNINGHKGSLGVSNLISYDVPEYDDYTQGVGYYGVGDKSDPIENYLGLDKSFKRTTPGTDIYIAGLIDDNLFEEKMVISVLDNFMYAIYKNTLEIKVNKIVINGKTLEMIVKKYDDKLKQTTQEMYILLTDKNVHKFNETIIETTFSDVEMYLKLEEGSSRKISMVRKPWMKIKNFDGFQRAYQFSGLVIIKGRVFNDLLRRIENPQHDDWQSDRLIDDPKSKYKVEMAIREVRARISKNLQEISKRELSSYLDIFGAKDYIPQISDDSKNKTQTKVEDKTVVIDIKEKVIQPVSNEILSFDDGDSIIESDGEEIVDIFRYEEETTTKSPHPKDRVIDELKKGRKVKLSKQNYRIIAIDPINGEYRIFLTVKNTDTYNIKFLLLDEQSQAVNNYLNILYAEYDAIRLQTQNDFIIGVKLNEGTNTIDVRFNLNNYFSVGVEIYEI